MVKLRIFNRIAKDQKGLSLIEVLIVMVITGMTLIALLNLATRDLEIEKINAQQDIGNYISLSQIQAFDAIKSAAGSGCLSVLAANVSIGKTSYYACSSVNYNASPVVQCNGSGNQSWYLFYAPSNTAYTSYNNCDPQGKNSPSTDTFNEILNMSNPDASTLGVNSIVNWTSLNNATQKTQISEQYAY